MGFVDKLMFWKKEDDFDFDKDLGEFPPSPLPEEGKDLNLPSLEGSPLPQRGRPGMDDFPKTEYSDPSMAHLEDTPRPLQQFQSQFTQSPRMASSEMSEKNMEVVSAKLDMLKVIMEGISQKLDNLMRLARDEDDQTPKYKRHW